MSRPILVCLGCLTILVSARPAAAYQIDSQFGSPCHELISVRAYNGVLDDIDVSDVPLPRSKTWRELARAIEQNLGIDYQNPQEELILVSLVVGTRAPDTDGHSVANFTQLRNIHLDPNGQYHHALRAADDDHAEGDLSTIDGTRAWIQQQTDAIGTSLDRAPAEQIITVKIFLDFYGRFDIEVWEPAFRMGVAAHALQDTFTHMLRSRDTRRVHHVLNFSDAVAGEHSEERDGMAHSDALDDCSEEGPARELARSAAQATEELFLALREELGEDDEGAVAKVLEDWTTHEPDCTADNDYCDSPWLELARERLTEPYLCNYSEHTINGSWHHVGLPWVLLLVGLAAWRHRSRRVRKRYGP